MELLTVLLSTLLAGLSAILLTIGLAAAARYRDARLGAVGGAQGLLMAIGILSLLHQLSPRYGGGFAVDDVPLALAVVAVVLLYVALVRRRPERAPEKHG
ncbi:MAG: hypothetical protein L3J95_03070 [Thermoplasmata archaeon]|nr:hypothetical protein [Thermoplasmata archaeon]MCI4359388.1 hypothetical protein [Thermoplasmata archaeon]